MFDRARRVTNNNVTSPHVGHDHGAGTDSCPGADGNLREHNRARSDKRTGADLDVPCQNSTRPNGNRKTERAIMADRCGPVDICMAADDGVRRHNNACVDVSAMPDSDGRCNDGRRIDQGRWPRHTCTREIATCSASMGARRKSEAPFHTGKLFNVEIDQSGQPGICTTEIVDARHRTPQSARGLYDIPGIWRSHSDQVDRASRLPSGSPEDGHSRTLTRRMPVPFAHPLNREGGR